MKKTVAILIVGGFMVSAAYVDARRAGDTVGERRRLHGRAGQARRSALQGAVRRVPRRQPRGLGSDAAAGGEGLPDELDRARRVGDLYEKTQTTMPATAPGTLTPEQAADIVAFMLSKDNYPAGIDSARRQDGAAAADQARRTQVEHVVQAA